MPRQPTPEFETNGLKSFGSAKPSTLRAPKRIGLTRDPRTVRRAAKRRLVRGFRELAAAEHIGELPGELEDVVLILTGRYHGFDVLTAMLDLAGYDAAELMIATLGFNRAQTDTLGELLDDGRIANVTFLVSHMFTEKNAGESAYLREALESRGHRYAVARNHAKLMLIRLTDGRHFVAHGSLNLRRCNSFEQLVITQDPALYGFFADYIREAADGEITP